MSNGRARSSMPLACFWRAMQSARRMNGAGASSTIRLLILFNATPGSMYLSRYPMSRGQHLEEETVTVLGVGVGHE